MNRTLVESSKKREVMRAAVMRTGETGKDTTASVKALPPIILKHKTRYHVNLSFAVPELEFTSVGRKLQNASSSVQLASLPDTIRFPWASNIVPWTS